MILCHTICVVIYFLQVYLSNMTTIYPDLREARPYHYRWIFGKVPKGGGGVISDPKNFVAKFLAFETPIWGGHFRSKNFRSKKSQHFSQKRPGGGGSKAVWNFSKNSSKLDRPGVPYLGYKKTVPRSAIHAFCYFSDQRVTFNLQVFGELLATGSVLPCSATGV